jgi:hypothetical protein
MPSCSQKVSLLFFTIWLFVRDFNKITAVAGLVLLGEETNAVPIKLQERNSEIGGGLSSLFSF